MNDLSVKYLGFQLRSPLILGSCGLSNSIEKLEEAEKKGFGAVVLKSIFEEQISHEVNSQHDEIDTLMYKQSYDYISQYQEMEAFEKYLSLIRKATKTLTIPIIASVNCATPSGWIKYIKAIQEAGANALEINYYVLPTNINKDANSYFKDYLKLIDEIQKVITIPYALKLSPYFTDLAHAIQILSYKGINGFVLFNRFHALDINIEKMEFTSSNILSNDDELSNTLRWIGLLSPQVKCDLSATTGVHNGEGLIKLLLAGASSVQAASIFYKKGLDYASTMLNDLNQWMTKHQFTSIKDFQGKMNYANVNNPDSYFRIQFMKYMSGIE